MKKVFVFSLAVVFCLGSTGFLFAADREVAKPVPVIMKAPAVGRPAAARRPLKSNLSMVVGTVTKIDNSDPANPKLEVNNKADNKLHTLQITPNTAITKITDLSEIKAGETVRVMSKKVEDKEVAMGVMFGKFKKPAPKRALMPPPAAVAKTPEEKSKK